MEWLMTEAPVIGIPVVWVLGAIGLWLLVGNRQTHIEPGSGLQAVVGRGEPIVLEFFGKL